MSTRTTLIVLWLLLAALVFGLQAPNEGFYGPNHGWTSSHGLAIITHATPANGFVGHALQQRAPDGSLGYTYFDRYPFFFSAGMNRLLSLAESLPVRVRLARGAMNVIYMATLFVAWRLVVRLTDRPIVAFGAVVLAFSGWWTVFYKDMVHYDQPALFGNFLLLWALARYKLDDDRRTVYLAALVAVSLGRGYSSYMILGLWALTEAVGLWRADGTLWAQFVRLMRHDAVLVTLAAILWGGAFLGYNLYTESVRRDAPLAETSIVDSALRRLPFGGEKDAGRTVGKDVPPWDAFAWLQFTRVPRWTLPFKLTDTPPVALPVTVGLWALAAAWWWRERRPHYRLLIGLTAVWGVFWLGFMINLAHGHRYTMMYGLGLNVVAWAAVGLFVSRWKLGTVAFVAVSLLAAGWANWSVRVEVSDPATNNAAYTYDYQRIREQLGADGQNIHVTMSDGECVINNDYCYVLGFYLGEHYLTDWPIADAVVGRLPYYHAEPVYLPPDDTDGLTLIRDTDTPANTTTHLFKRARAETRTLPDQLGVVARFGDALTLAHWHIPDALTVPSCSRVHLESWWLTDTPLDTDYSFLLALVDADGATVADANADLTTLNTAVWLTGHYHFDARYVDVPCDAPAGEYPLVASVYAPNAERSLDVFDADGNALSTFLYLTTVIVE
jgi:hypothetical protein